MKRIIALLLALMMVFALFACGKKEESAPGADTSDPGSGSSNPAGAKSAADGESLATLDKAEVHPSADATLRFAGSGAPNSLCYLSGNGMVSSLTPISVFYDTLVSYDKGTGEFLPCLATAWERTDSNTIRFTLRKDVKSHMGDPFTASDVIYSLEWGCSNPKCAGAYASVFDIEKCKVVDDYTVDVALLSSSPFILFDMSKFSYGMVVEASVEKLGGKEAAGDKPLMATGPYKFTEWDKTNEVFYGERNEEYWGTLPYYKNFESSTVVDATARCMSIEAGNVNSAQGPTSNAVIAAINNPSIKTYIDASTIITRWDLNSDYEPLSVKEVRQALALAVNYEAIAQVCYGGYSDICDSVMPEVNDWHTSPDEGEKEFYFYYDIDRAKEKLVEGGYPDGFELGIAYRSGKADITAAVEIMQNAMKEIGITVKVEQWESATLGDKISKGEFQSLITGNPSATPTGPLKQLDPRLNANTGHKWMLPIEKEYYELVDKCHNTIDLEECYGYLDQWQDICREYVPVIPIANQKSFNMTTSDVVNIALDIADTILPASFYAADYLAD